MTSPSFSEWFCLRSDRDNYTIVPERDHEFLFGNAGWKIQIKELLEMSLLLREPLRVVWWGQYGIGKTHRIQYMQNLIQKNGLAFKPVFVVCRDLVDKSGFDRLHYDLVNNLGFESTRMLVSTYVKKVELGTSTAPRFEAITPIRDVANAMTRLGDSNSDIAAAAWKFLLGQTLEAAQTRLANVSKEEVDSSVEYAAILKCFASVIEHEERKQLIYMLDQVEAIGKITNRNAEAAWIETFRAILDLQNVGLVLSIGAERMDGIPTIVLAPEIVSRFKQNNYLQMPAYEEEVASDFLKGLLAQWTDSTKRDEIARAEKLESVPGFKAETYPFTGPAFEVFCRYLTNDPRLAKPREIIERLNRVAAQACLKRQRVITRDVLTEQGISA